MVRNEGRDQYLDALELADAGDLRELVKLFAGLLVRAVELWQATL